MQRNSSDPGIIHIVIKAWPKHTGFFPSIFNPWETFFLPQQIKGGWVRRQGPDQLSKAAISTVLSVWHTSKIWALSKAKEAISQQGKLFSSILLYWYLPLLNSFFPAIISLHYFTLSCPSIFFCSHNLHFNFVTLFGSSLLLYALSINCCNSIVLLYLFSLPLLSWLYYFDKCHLVKKIQLAAAPSPSHSCAGELSRFPHF